MFCDGICKKQTRKGEVRCGMLRQFVILTATGEIKETIDKCNFHELVDTMHDQLKRTDLLHTSIDRKRNEEVKTGHDIQGVIANLGLVVHKAITGDPSAQINYNNINKILEKCDDGEDQEK